MKVTIDIDCTPAEARHFLGLPNLEPIQTAVMDRMQEKMLGEIDRFSPESLMKQWLTVFPQQAERMQELFAGDRNTGDRSAPRTAEMTKRVLRAEPSALQPSFSAVNWSGRKPSSCLVLRSRTPGPPLTVSSSSKNTAPPFSSARRIAARPSGGSAGSPDSKRGCSSRRDPPARPTDRPTRQEGRARRGTALA